MPKRLTADDLRYREITEAMFQKQVIGLATLLGWHTLHIRHAPEVRGGKVTRYTTPVQGSIGKGWPDLVLVRRDRIIFAELKSETGKLTTEQVEVLDILSGAAKEVYHWRPRDIDEIAALLA